MSAAPHSSDGMELGPPSDAFTVEFRGLGEDIHDAVDSPAQLICFEERQRARLQECAAVVGRDLLRTPGADSQPRLSAGTQDVPERLLLYRASALPAPYRDLRRILHRSRRRSRHQHRAATWHLRRNDVTAAATV